MNGYRESDSFIVPEKLSNKVMEVTAEVMEGRELAKGKPPERSIYRTQSRGSMRNELERIRKAEITSIPEVGAVCGNSARTDLWRGLQVTVIPTPTFWGNPCNLLIRLIRDLDILKCIN